MKLKNSIDYINIDVSDRILNIMNKYSMGFRDSSVNKEQYEQFFTSIKIADFMSNMVSKNTKQKISLLDPGCGLGILAFSLIEKILLWESGIQEIDLVLYEIDSTLIPQLTDICLEVKHICNSNGVELKYDIRNKDFIIEGIKEIRHFEKKFDLIIMNPPYGKIENSSIYDESIKQVGVKVPNLYAGFITIALQFLSQNGQLVAITPRSFCNGLYFTDYRNFLLRNISFEHIHLFESRSDCFEKDNVLQEVMVYKLKRSKQRKKVMITHSKNGSFSNMDKHLVGFDDIIDFDDEHKFIKVIRSAKDEKILDLMSKMPYTLEQLHLEVSTGPIVDFRVKEGLLSKDISLDSYPIIFPEHFVESNIEWPKSNIKKKYNSIIFDDTVRNQLRPNSNYVFVKRFSSKEEKKRVVAAVWEKKMAWTQYIGIDNKVNYYHLNKNGIELDIAKGLAAYLNSSFVDKWFRLVSGSTQVNVTDLRKMRYPTKEILTKLIYKDSSEIQIILEKEYLNDK